MTSSPNRLNAVNLKVLLALGAALCVAMPLAANAQTHRIDGYKATLANVENAEGVSMRIELVRWSTDAEHAEVLEALASDGEGDAMEALKGMPTAGVVWTSVSSVGYAVKYARREELPSGVVRVALIVDRPLGGHELRPWAPLGGMATDYPFTLIELRVPDQETGEGKLSLSAEVAVDSDDGLISLKNYDAAPAHLVGVTHVP